MLRFSSLSLTLWYLVGTWISPEARTMTMLLRPANLGAEGWKSLKLMVQLSAAQAKFRGAYGKPSWFAEEREKLGPNNLAPTCRHPA